MSWKSPAVPCDSDVVRCGLASILTVHNLALPLIRCDVHDAFAYGTSLDRRSCNWSPLWGSPFSALSSLTAYVRVFGARSA